MWFFNIDLSTTKKGKYGTTNGYNQMGLNNETLMGPREKFENLAESPAYYSYSGDAMLL